MEMAKVTSKGQITIPVSIRRRLQINEGDKLLFIDRPEGVMMVNPDLLGSEPDVDSTPDMVAEPATSTVKTRTKSQVKTYSTSSSSKPASIINDTETISNNEYVIEEEIETAVVPSSIVIKPPSETANVKKNASVGDLNLDSLLDEIRSIGRKI
jgi:AbrB family looped-hinge helix DNA binding protein